MKRRTAHFLLASVCLCLVVAGGWTEVALRPRAVPRPAAPLKNTQAPTLSQAELESLLSKAASRLDPQLRSRLADAVLAESARAGYDPLFVLAVVAVESGWRVGVSSERGAAGLMQLKPSTFAWISAREPDIGGEDGAVAEDPVIDVRLAVRYIHWLEKRFRSRDEALMAYNAGPRRVQEYQKVGEFPDRLLEYPRRVMREYQRLVRLQSDRVEPGALIAQQ